MHAEQDEGPRTAGLCGRCSPTERNRYYRGKLLTVSDYQTEQGYMIGRRRLINRTMLGWGVVAGFAIQRGERFLAIGTGVALDPAGRELLACEEVRLERPHDLIWIGRGKCGYEPIPAPEKSEKQSPNRESESGANPGDRYLLRAHYAEVPVDGIRVDDGCGAAACEANHLCETVVYSLERVERRDAGLPDCPGGRDARGQSETAEPATEATDGAVAEGEDRHRPLPSPMPGVHDRGPQARLCAWSDARLDALGIGDGHDGADPCRREQLRQVGGLWVDLDAGVPLAWVRIARDDCGDPALTAVEDACRPRRLARPNETLFDLIRGCDLTRIDDIGWRDWHASPDGVMDFGTFRERFREPPNPDGDPPGAAETDFWVRVSGPVRTDSLTPDIFTIRVLHGDDDEGYYDVARVMVDSIAFDPPEYGDPAGTTRRFWPAVSGYFYNGELRPGQRTKFKEKPVIVELILDGDRVIDAAGQCLDASRRGRALPSGNGTPGGLFTSEFRVRRGPKGEKPLPDSAEGDAR